MGREITDEGKNMEINLYGAIALPTRHLFTPEATSDACESDMR
jgi:hypothetical protein